MEDKVVPDWRKSSYSGNGGGNCVGVGAAARAIAVRDTKQDGAGPVLRFPRPRGAGSPATSGAR